MMRTLHAVVALAVGISAWAGPAEAACSITGVQSVSPSTFTVGTYSATLLPPPVTVTLNVTLLVNGNGGGCKGEYGLVRSSAPASMSRLPAAAVSLPYGVTSAGSPILSFGATSTARRRLPNFNVKSNETTATVAMPFTITPQAPVGMPTSGSYADQLTLALFDVQGSTSIQIGQVQIGVAAQVVNSCSLSAPGALSMNFTSDVATGVPTGAAQSTTFNVNCTGPARVQLSGAALTAPVPASGVFDNFINYRASATFGGATTTLITSGSSSTNAVSSSMSALTGTNLPVGVSVTLIPGRPLIGSTTYSGALRVTVDPAL